MGDARLELHEDEEIALKQERSTERDPGGFGDDSPVRGESPASAIPRESTRAGSPARGEAPSGGPEAVDRAWKALSEVIDPEVGLDIVSMGLVYGVEVWPDGSVQVEMTLTTPGCPVGGYIVKAAKAALRRAFPGAVTTVNLVWQPPWSPAMIAPGALEKLRRR